MAESEINDLDLTPQERSAVGPSRYRNWIILGAFSAIAGFVLWNALDAGTIYFHNVDEAVAERAELEGEVFRIQGTVVDEPTVGPENSLVFTIAFGGVDAEIRHIGDEPSSLFDVGQPVVAEGQWVGDQFESRLVTVKHSEQYVEDNPDRVDYELDETTEANA